MTNDERCLMHRVNFDLSAAHQGLMRLIEQYGSNSERLACLKSTRDAMNAIWKDIMEEHYPTPGATDG